MGDLVHIENAREQREKDLRQEQERIANALDFMATQARAGTIIGVCLVAIPNDRKSLTIAAQRLDGCGPHELVGAASILAAHIANMVSQP